MAATHASTLALFIQSAPYKNRVARADVDLALAAAALDFNIRVYFPGRSAMQLVAQRNASEAQLPAGYRAWAALPDLASTRVFVEREWLDFCLERRLELVMPVESLDTQGFRESWRSCDHVIVL
jgi:sulfur relay (sulfurtransferase) DsrF/TusC family protein